MSIAVIEDVMSRVIQALNKQKGYAFSVLLILALGIALNITVFNATNEILMRLMEVPEAQFLIQLYSGS